MVVRISVHSMKCTLSPELLSSQDRGDLNLSAYNQALRFSGERPGMGCGGFVPIEMWPEADFLSLCLTILMP